LKSEISNLKIEILILLCDNQKIPAWDQADEVAIKRKTHPNLTEKIYAAQLVR
jgi:hypothetical protein